MSDATTRRYRRWLVHRDEDTITWLSPVGAHGIGYDAVRELEELIPWLRQSSRGVVLHLGTETAVIGTELDLLRHIANSETPLEELQALQKVFRRLAGLPITSVALIDGRCSGLALELALNCRWRLASDAPHTRLAFDDIDLGVHPLGGTSVRLPALVGSKQALRLLVDGSELNAMHAQRLGLVDHLEAPARLPGVAAALARRKQLRPSRSLAVRISKLPWLRKLAAQRLRAQYQREPDEQHLPARAALFDLWEQQAVVDPYQAEAESFVRLVRAEPTRARVHLSRARRGLARLTAGHRPPHQVHVVGAGPMGRALAARAVLHGFNVTLQDTEKRQLAAAVRETYAYLKETLLDTHRARAVLDRLQPDPEGHGARRATFVLEATTEDLETKGEVLRALDLQLRPGAVLASTTASLDLIALADRLIHPERFLGLHFLNPVSPSPIVELATTARTDPSARDLACGLLERLELLAMPVNAQVGYLINRCLVAVLDEAALLFDEGVSATVIDAAARRFGMREGPLEFADRVGLAHEMITSRNVAESHDREPSHTLETLVASGRLGASSGAGFYDYREGEPIKAPPGPDHTSLDDVADRLLYRLLNEAVACLREGVVDEPETIDIGLVLGAGFPVYRGGPLYFLWHRGIEASEHRLHELTNYYGERFEPDAGWALLAERTAHYGG